MRTLNFVVDEKFNNHFVIDVLRHHFHCSSKLIKILKRQETGILLNGEHARTVDLISVGDVVEINIPVQPGFIEKTKMELDIVYQDSDILVVNKPPFMPVHPSRNHFSDTLANGVAYYLSENGIETAFRAINRLDRDTSGLVLVGLNSYSASRLSQSLQKKYIALVDGEYHGSGTIDLPIRRVGESIIQRQVGEGGETAITHWTAVKNIGKTTLMEIILETGRTHQIRVHFSHLGTPLVGDTLYSGGDSRISRQALHCQSISFQHPITGKEICLTSDLPTDIAMLLDM